MRKGTVVSAGVVLGLMSACRRDLRHGAPDEGGAGGAAAMVPIDAGDDVTGDLGAADSSETSRGRDCEPGRVRCGATATRQRCGADGSWLQEDYVCTVAVAGNEDYSVFCAIKADGRLACWGNGDWMNQQVAMLGTQFAIDSPSRRWIQVGLSDGAFGACGLDAAGVFLCQSVLNTTIVAPSSALRFRYIQPTIYGTCGILQTGDVACFGATTVPADFVGPFKQIRVSSFQLFGIDQADQLHVPDYMAQSFPAGRYSYLAANNDMVCAVRDDTRIYCSTGASDVGPGSEVGFVEVAIAYGRHDVCGLRDDGSLRCWTIRDGDVPLTPPPGTFAQVAAGGTFMCAIRIDGTTSCWGDETLYGPTAPPPGW
jgi:hypothetical protein